MDKYYSGEYLYGDDFDLKQIESWFEDEKEGYAELGAKEKESYKYDYHSLNKICAYNSLKMKEVKRVLGVGSAYGDELKPILKVAKKITILEPSGAFTNTDIEGVSCEYVMPEISGEMKFNNDEFDLITCFGVLHHIPNVSFVISEITRCLSSNGTALIREPITSMGGWGGKRPGLTKRERGIPLDVFNDILEKSGLEVVKKTYCVFPPLAVICGRFNIPLFNSSVLVYLDIILSRLFLFNYKYHAEGTWDKFRPGSVFYVLKKK